MPSEDAGVSAAGTGRGVRIAIVDSGVRAGHPHVGGIAGGVRIRADGGTDSEWADEIGHGTAVAAAIHEKAPAAELLAVRVFDRALASDVRVIVRAIEWAAREGCQLINLSLGTSRPEHERVLGDAVAMARDAGAVIVAAGMDQGHRWLPGCLPGVLQVRVEWSLARQRYVLERDEAGTATWWTSGYPRPVPGVPVERNLKGVSFAVANMTGFAARVVAPGERLSLGALAARLASGAFAIYEGNPADRASSAGGGRT